MVKVNFLSLNMLSVAVLGVWPLLGGALQASQDQTDSMFTAFGGAERIDAADVMRTISQEIPAAACYMHHGIDVDVSTAYIEAAKLRFVERLDGLENGLPSLGILGKEERPSVLAEIRATRQQWEPMMAAVYALIADPSNENAYRYVKNANAKLFDLSYLLLAELEAEYANPVELLALDAILIDIAGRQEMLTQKILKEACEIWAGHDDKAHKDDLKASIALFERGINALHDGLPELGIIPAPTPEIKTALEDVVADWDNVKVLLAAVDSGTLDDAGKSALFEILHAKMEKLEDVVHMYVDYSKHDYSS